MEKRSREQCERSYAGGVVDRVTKGVLFAVAFVICLQVLSIGIDEAVYRISASLLDILLG